MRIPTCDFCGRTLTEMGALISDKDGPGSWCNWCAEQPVVDEYRYRRSKLREHQGMIGRTAWLPKGRPMLDGWYMIRSDAQAVLDLIEKEGAIPLGVVESQYGTWGALYVSERVLFDNHRFGEWPVA